MKSRSPLVVLLLLVVLAALVVRWEDWEYRDAAGGSVFQFRGVLLPWQETQAPPAGVGVTTVAVHKRTVLGFNRYDYVGPPAGLSPVAPVAGTALRSPGH